MTSGSASGTGAETPPPPVLLTLVEDLLFASRIESVARARGWTLQTATPATALARIRELRPRLIILDLAGPGDPLGVVRAVRAEAALEGVAVLGFYPHVDQERRRAAVAAGVDHVVPRSALVARLPVCLAQGRIPPAGADC